MKKVLIYVMLLICSHRLFGQTIPELEWAQLGVKAPFNNSFYKVLKPTKEGGFFTGGKSSIGDQHGSQDNIVIKKWNAKGKPLWEKKFGGSGWDEISDAIQTRDGGFIFIGTTTSPEIPGHHVSKIDTIPNYDIWVVKLAPGGAVEWQLCLGGSGFDTGYGISQSAESGYFITGSTNSVDGDVIGRKEGDLNRAWLVKLNSIGGIIWQNVFPDLTRMMSQAYSVTRTSDGGCVVGGAGHLYGPELQDQPLRINNVYLKKFNKNGEVLWDAVYGSSGNDNAKVIRELSDSSLIVGGSYDIYDSGNVGWLLKLDSNGKKIWDSHLGFRSRAEISAIDLTKDGGFLVTSSGLWNEHMFAKLDSRGKTEWEINVENKDQYERYMGIAEVGEGEFVAGGWEEFYHVDFHRSRAFKLVKYAYNYKKVNTYEIPTQAINADGTIKKEVVSMDRGKIIRTAAADGATKLLIDMAASAPVKFSVNGSNNGYLSTLTNQQSKVQQITEKPVNGKIALLYQVPESFGNSYDPAGREITLDVTFSNKETGNIYIKLVPAPVVLVHGMWSSPQVWTKGGFVDQLKKSGFSNIQLADYSADNEKTFDPLSDESLPARSAILGAIQKGLDKYRKYDIAVSRVDIVAHSLGGLQSRSLSQQGYFNNPRNFYQGYINKLITIGTPHLGSAFGPLLFSKADPLVQFRLPFTQGQTELFSPVYGIFGFTGQNLGSALRDFNPDLARNPAMSNMKATKNSYVHAITGNWQPGADQTQAVWNAMSLLLFQKSLKTIFGTEDHDLIVSAASQSGGLQKNYVSDFSNTIHSGMPTSNYIKDITETDNPAIQGRVTELLLDSKEQFANEFPAPSAATVKVVDQAKLAASSFRATADHQVSIMLDSGIRTQVVGQQQSFELSYTISPGTVLTQAALFIEGAGVFEAPIKSPLKLTIPLTADRYVGTARIALIARDQSGILIGDTSRLTIKQTLKLKRISCDLEEIRLDSSIRQVQLSVKGHFENGKSVLVQNISSTDPQLKYQLKLNSGISNVNGNGLLTALKPGTDSLVIDYQQQRVTLMVTVDENFRFRVLKANTIISPVIPPQQLGGPDLRLPGYASSGLPLTYTMVSGQATIKNGVITMLNSGRVRVKYSQQGNAFFLPAKEMIATFCVSEAVLPAIQGADKTCTTDQTYSVPKLKDVNYDWSLSGGGYFTSSDTSATVTWRSVGTHTISVRTRTIDGCLSEAVTLNVTVTDPTIPIIKFTNKTPSFCKGDSLVLQSSLEKNNQWYLNGTAISGATSNSYVAKSAGAYTLRETGNRCSGVSQAVKVTVNPVPAMPVIVSATNNYSFCSLDSLQLKSTETYNNQWFFNNEAIPGATKTSIYVKKAGSYTLRQINGTCAAFSRAVEVRVIPVSQPPVISSDQPTLTLCQGSTMTLSSSLTQGNQWYLNDIPIANAFGSTITISKAGYYSVKHKEQPCALPSNILQISVEPPAATPTISVQGMNAFFEGDSALLTTSATGILQWLLNGSPIPNATGKSLWARHSGNYQVEKRNGSCAAFSQPVKIQVNAILPPIISASGPTVFPSGQSVTLGINREPGLRYQWYKDGVIIDKATQTSYTATQSGNYQVGAFVTDVIKKSSPVQVQVIFTLPVSNFKLSATSVSCRGKSDGVINIYAEKELNYYGTVTGGALSRKLAFTRNLIIDGLPPGVYEVCILMSGQPDFKKCYQLNIAEPAPLSADFQVANGSGTVKIHLYGSTAYRLEMNGKVYSVTDSIVSLQLVNGKNLIQISSDKLCQGAIYKTLEFNQTPHPYPNPFQNYFYLQSGNANSVFIKVFNSSGQQVHQSQNKGGSDIFIDTSAFTPGIYIVQVNRDGQRASYKLMKL